jgi:hypothetical protein
MALVTVCYETLLITIPNAVSFVGYQLRYLEQQIIVSSKVRPLVIIFLFQVAGACVYQMLKSCLIFENVK